MTADAYPARHCSSTPADRLCLVAAPESSGGGKARSVFVRHARLAQAGEKSRLRKLIGPRRSKQPPLLETGYAGVALIAAEPARLGEFLAGAVPIPEQSIGRGQPRMRTGQTRVRAARPFQSGDRFVHPGLQQVDHADAPIPVGQPRIARAEADRAFLGRDGLLDPACEKFAY